MKFHDMPYERVDFDQVEKAFEELKKSFAAARNAEEQFEIHQKYYELRTRTDTMITLAQIRHDGDVTDAFYNAEQDYYDQMGPKYSNMIIEYQKLLYESPYRDGLEERIGRVAFKNMELARKSMQEKLIPLVQEENALATSYEKLVAAARIEWDGQTLNLSLLKPYLKNPDRNIRRKAWEKFSAFFRIHQQELDEIYDKLVKNRTLQAKELGYENYVELGYMRMSRNCYTRQQVEDFRNQVKKDFVPFVEKLHEERRKRLGLEKLSYIDEGVYYKEGNPAPIGTPEEILEAGRNMYEELSPETKEFFDFMMDNGLFDVLGRKNKRVGGYMTYLPLYQAPFIFANFNGTSGDVDVITHECGHAFQGYLAGKDPIMEHADITMETAECHSMSMEFFTEKWMDRFFGNGADAYRRMHLEDACMFIPYGCMVDEFQHIIYENPELTPLQRKEVWRSLEKEYKPHLDYEGDPFFGEGGYWQQQHHIYSVPFYYIDYVIAQTVAFEYKLWMDEDYKAAWQSYLKLCKLSASDFFTNMIPEVGLKLPFEAGCMKEMAEKLEKKLMKEV